MRVLRYAWEEALASLGRARWTLGLSIATIAVAFAMLGAFRVVSATIASVAGGWREAAEVSVYLDDVVTDVEREAIRQVIARSAGVASVDLVTKEEALARFGAEFPELGDVTASLDANPFPASFEIRLTDAGMGDGADELAAALRAQPGVADVRYDRQWLARLLAVITAMRTAGWAAALALVLGAMTTVIAVVRLSFEARRDEIGIMALVGAPVAFIRGPFVMEGAIQGALGALAALGGLALLGRAIGRAMGPLAAALGPDAVHPLTPWDMVALLGGGALVGAVAGLLATWRWDPQGPLPR
ncbi:MAG: cell division protein FtsX [Vicinamibacterales bacterium]